MINHYFDTGSLIQLLLLLIYICHIIYLLFSHFNSTVFPIILDTQFEEESQKILHLHEIYSVSMLEIINIQMRECFERGTILKNIWDGHVYIFNKFINEFKYEKKKQSTEFLTEIEEIKISTLDSLKSFEKKIRELEESLVKQENETNYYKKQISSFEDKELKFKKKYELLTEALKNLRQMYEDALLENINFKLKSKNNDSDFEDREFLKKQQQTILNNKEKKDQSIFEFLKEIAFFNNFEKKGSSKFNNLKNLLSQIVQIDDASKIENVDNFEEICKDAYNDTEDLIIQKEKEIWTENFFLKHFTQEKEVQTLFYDELPSENRKNTETSLDQDSLEECSIDQNIIFQITQMKNNQEEELEHYKKNAFCNQNKFKMFEYSDVQRIFDSIKEIEELLIRTKKFFSKIYNDENETSNSFESKVSLGHLKEIDISIENCKKISSFLKEMKHLNNQSQLAIKIENLETKLDLEELENIKSVYQSNFEQIKEKFLQFFKEAITVDEQFLSNEDLTSMNSITSNSMQPQQPEIFNVKRKGSVFENSIFLSVNTPNNKLKRNSMMKSLSHGKKPLEPKELQKKSLERKNANEINDFDEKNNSLSNINNEIFDDPSIMINPENSLEMNNGNLNVNNVLTTSSPHQKISSFKPRKSARLSILFDKGQKIKNLLNNSEFNMKEALEKEVQLKSERYDTNKEMTNLINQVGDFLSKKKRWSRIQGINSDKCASFLIKLHNSQLKSNQSSSLNIILKIISQTYSEILKAYQTKQTTLNPLFFIFYEFILQKSGGSKERSENKITRIVQSLQLLNDNHRIKMFMKLLSLTKIENAGGKEKKEESKNETNIYNQFYDFYDGNDLKLYLDLLAKFDDNPMTNMPGLMFAMSSSDSVITSLNKAIEITKDFSGNFFLKRGQQHKIENVINLLKRAKQKDPMVFRKYVVDVDYAIERIFEIRDLMIEMYQTAFKAADLHNKSGLDLNEFLFIIRNIERKNLSDEHIIKLFNNEFDFEIEGSNEKCMSFKRFAYVCQEKNILNAKNQEEFLNNNFSGLKNIFELKKELEFRRDLIKIKFIKTKTYNSYYRNMIKIVDKSVNQDNLNEKDASIIWMRFRLLDDESNNFLVNENMKEILCDSLISINDFFQKKLEQKIH